MEVVVTAEDLRALTKPTKFYDGLTQDRVSVKVSNEYWIETTNSNKFQTVTSMDSYNGWLRRRKLGVTAILYAVNFFREQCELQIIKLKDLWPVTLEELDRVEFLEKIKGGSNVSK